MFALGPTRDASPHRTVLLSVRAKTRHRRSWADCRRAEVGTLLMDLLGQNDQDSKSSRPPLIAEIVSKTRAAGWGNDAILTAVSDPTSREAKIFRSSLISRVQQWDRQMNFPYRDPVLPYLPPPEPEQVEAMRHAASAASAATDAARAATSVIHSKCLTVTIPDTCH
jgi:hypothetical protein